MPSTRRRNTKKRSKGGGRAGLEPGQVIHAVLDIKNPATLSCSGEKFNYYEKTFFLFTSLFYMHGQQGYRFHKML